MLNSDFLDPDVKEFAEKAANELEVTLEKRIPELFIIIGRYIERMNCNSKNIDQIFQKHDVSLNCKDIENSVLLDIQDTIKMIQEDKFLIACWKLQAIKNHLKKFLGEM